MISKLHKTATKQKKDLVSTGKTYSYTRKKMSASNISIVDFLRLPLEERLPLITNPTVQREDLHEGMEVHFDFAKNKELELCISLAEILPKSVRKISIGKNVGTRSMMTGEYLTQKERRLSLCDGAKITVLKTDTPEHILSMRMKKMAQVVSSLSLQKFLNLPFTERLQLVTKMTRNPRELNKGDVLCIDFHGNTELESHISLNDILPDTVRAVEVTDNKGKKRIGRRNWCRFFMTENEQRIVILTGYKVKILHFSLQKT
jgi:hypothetical protein